MRAGEAFAAALLGCAAPLLAAGPPPPPPLPPLVLEAKRPLVTATIAGQPVQLRIDPAADSFIVLTPAAAARLQLDAPERLVAGKPVRRGTLQTLVGQVELKNPFSWEEVVIAGRPAVIRVVTPAIAPIADADGSISPGQLPYPLVRLVQRPVTAADTETPVPVRRDTIDGLVADIRIGKSALEVQFAPDSPQTIATVAAGAIIADVGNGRITGPVERADIAYGVARPVRRLVLGRPVAIAGFAIRDFQVRLFDWSGKFDLPPDADAGAEITVSGRRGRQRGRPMFNIGADHLAACAEIRWDSQADSFTLICPSG